jgi:hypothetical protein
MQQQSNTKPATAGHAFEQKVAAEMKAEPGISRADAVARVAKAYPDVHQSYIQAANPGRKL